MKKILIFLIFTIYFSNINFSQNNESFSTFYEKFFKDTAFQSKRTIFPLKGSEKLSKKEIGHLSKIKEKEYKAMDSAYIIETKRESTACADKAYIPYSEVMIKMEFKLINKKWFLSYYYNSFLVSFEY